MLLITLFALAVSAAPVAEPEPAPASQVVLSNTTSAQATVQKACLARCKLLGETYDDVYAYITRSEYIPDHLLNTIGTDWTSIENGGCVPNLCMATTIAPYSKNKTPSVSAATDITNAKYVANPKLKVAAASVPASTLSSCEAAKKQLLAAYAGTFGSAMQNHNWIQASTLALVEQANAYIEKHSCAGALTANVAATKATSTAKAATKATVTAAPKVSKAAPPNGFEPPPLSISSEDGKPYVPVS